MTPLPGAFTTPIASARLGSLLDDRTLVVETDFRVGWIDPETRTLVPYDEREIPFDVRNLLEAGRAAPEVLRLPPDEHVRGLEQDGRHGVDLRRRTNCYRGVTWGDRSS